MLWGAEGTSQEAGPLAALDDAVRNVTCFQRVLYTLKTTETSLLQVLWGTEGTGQEADLRAALDDAVTDAVDVINVSPAPNTITSL